MDWEPGLLGNPVAKRSLAIEDAQSNKTPFGTWDTASRTAYSAQGQGFATELSLEAIKQAKMSRPALPIVAYLLEHNLASARVAEKVGLSLVHRGIDAGNPDPTAIRLAYADRQLSTEESSQVMH